MNTLYVATPRSSQDRKVGSFGSDPTPIQACAAKFGHELVVEEGVIRCRRCPTEWMALE
jgi:hypothetical protein